MESVPIRLKADKSYSAVIENADNDQQENGLGCNAADGDCVFGHQSGEPS